MAKWMFGSPSWVPIVVADTTTMTANGAMAILPGSTTQLITSFEFYLGGLATASAPMIMVVARDHVIAATALGLGTSGRNAPLSPFTAALAAAQNAIMTATTMPQRFTTGHLLELAFNAFGGIVRWVAAPGEEIKQYGTAVDIGEVSLSAFTGSTASTSIASHWVYEPD
jgi:hypothetical protein